MPINHSAVSSRTFLNCFKWGDQVCEVYDSRAPTHGQYAIGSTTAGETVRTADGRGSIGAYEGDAPRVLEWKSTSGVLQENDAGGGDLASDFPVIASDVDVLILGIVQWVPRIEVGLWEPGVLTKEVPASKNANGRRVRNGKDRQGTQSAYRVAISSTRASGIVPLLTYAVRFPPKYDSSLLNEILTMSDTRSPGMVISRPVMAEMVLLVAAQSDIITSNEIGDIARFRQPVASLTSLEPKLSLQSIAHQLFVLARVRVVY